VALGRYSDSPRISEKADKGNAEGRFLFLPALLVEGVEISNVFPLATDSLSVFACFLVFSKTCYILTRKSGRKRNEKASLIPYAYQRLTPCKKLRR